MASNMEIFPFDEIIIDELIPNQERFQSFVHSDKALNVHKFHLKFSLRLYYDILKSHLRRL